MPRIQVKEIWKVNLPDTQANEQAGYRPAVILSIHQTSVTMVVPFTKNLDCKRFSHTHLVRRSGENGLTSDSIALIFQMRCLGISAARFVELIGTLEDNHLNEIKTLIKDYLSIV
jgi:mRNA interferase MazF